jgi:hypothetical protein
MHDSSVDFGWAGLGATMVGLVARTFIAAAIGTLFLLAMCAAWLADLSKHAPHTAKRPIARARLTDSQLLAQGRPATAGGEAT